jgi:hypothetical protein
MTAVDLSASELCATSPVKLQTIIVSYSSLLRVLALVCAPCRKLIGSMRCVFQAFCLAISSSIGSQPFSKAALWVSLRIAVRRRNAVLSCAKVPQKRWSCHCLSFAVKISGVQLRKTFPMTVPGSLSVQISSVRASSGLLSHAHSSYAWLEAFRQLCVTDLDPRTLFGFLDFHA